MGSGTRSGKAEIWQRGLGLMLRVVSQTVDHSRRRHLALADPVDSDEQGEARGQIRGFKHVEDFR